MTNEEAINILRPIAERRRTFRVGGQVREAAPDYIDTALRLAIAALERDRWISVEDRLPEKEGHYLASDGPSVFEAFFGGETTWYDPVEEWDEYTVDHWMQLPEPPKEEI